MTSWIDQIDAEYNAIKYNAPRIPRDHDDDTHCYGDHIDAVTDSDFPPFFRPTYDDSPITPTTDEDDHDSPILMPMTDEQRATIRDELRASGN